MRVGLIIETVTHLGLALGTTDWVAMVIMFVFGAQAFVWGTTSRTVRMRAVSMHLQGRVNSLYLIGVCGGIVVGQALGGAIARMWGITGPFWFAFVTTCFVCSGGRLVNRLGVGVGEPALVLDKDWELRLSSPARRFMAHGASAVPA